MADVSVIDFGDGNGNRNVKDKSAARSSAIAPVEDGSTSSAAYSVGDYICRNGQLYKVTTAIAIGDVIGNNIQLTKVVDEMGSGGGGNSLSKTRYTITATNWSNSTDANGYYTYTITLNPELSLSWPPSTDIAGVNDSTFSTDTEKEAYDLLDECNLTDTDTLVLYAKTKPTVNFYIWVEGEVAS